jgi:hypothetical protein
VTIINKKHEKLIILNLNDEFSDQSLASIYSLDSTAYLPPPYPFSRSLFQSE